MNAPLPPGAESVVLVERFDNVIRVQWLHPEDPCRSVTGKAPAGRPLLQRLARSPFADDLRDHAFTVGLIVGLLAFAGAVCAGSHLIHLILGATS